MQLKGSYVVECFRNGEKIWEECFSNVVTVEGRNNLLQVGIAKTEVPANWYVGLIGNDVTPTENDTASAVLGASGSYGEITSYTSQERLAYTATFGGNSVSNASSPASFVFNANETVYGVFIASSSTKGSNSGVLLSAGRFGSPKNVANGDVLAITYIISSTV